MKLRRDFVSNSSSTSYVFISDNEKDCLSYCDEMKDLLYEWINDRFNAMEPCMDCADGRIVKTTCKIVSDQRFIEDWWKPRGDHDNWSMFDGPPLYIVPNSLMMLLSIFDADVKDDYGDLVITPQFIACKEKIKDFIIGMLQKKYKTWRIAYSNVDNADDDYDYDGFSKSHFPEKTIWQTSYDS